MKRSNWIALGLLICLWGTVVLAGAGPSGQTQTEDRIRIQEARLPEIEAVAAQERAKVDQWHRTRRARLVQEIARPYAARLSFAQRELWVQFADLYLDRFYAPAYFNFGFTTYETALIGYAMLQDYLISETADILVNTEFEQILRRIVEERIIRERRDVPFLPLLRERATEFLNLMQQVRSELDMNAKHLEYQRNARLDAITEWENGLKEDVRGILEYLRQSESRPVRFGVVESVGFCVNSGYYAMIEGVDRVLTVGDRIGEVRIVAIDPEKVEFARNGTTWTQLLGAPPQPFWSR